MKDISARELKGHAKVKYNRPDELVKSMGGAFAQWDGVRS